MMGALRARMFRLRGFSRSGGKMGMGPAIVIGRVGHGRVHTFRSRSLDEGMFMASRYLATVRRATWIPDSLSDSIKA